VTFNPAELELGREGSDIECWVALRYNGTLLPVARLYKLQPHRSINNKYRLDGWTDISAVKPAIINGVERWLPASMAQVTSGQDSGVADGLLVLCITSGQAQLNSSRELM
jgi:hypothetical protein